MAIYDFDINGGRAGSWTSHAFVMAMRTDAYRSAGLCQCQLCCYCQITGRAMDAIDVELAYYKLM